MTTTDPKESPSKIITNNEQPLEIEHISLPQDVSHSENHHKDHSFNSTSTTQHIFVENKSFTFSFILLFSIIGTLIRVSVSELFSYSKNFNILPVQILGCFIFGLAVPFKARFLKFHPSSYKVIQAGLCGSITTFSTFSLDLFKIVFIRQQDDNTSDSVNRVFTGIEYIMLTLCCGFASMIYGKYIGNWMNKRLKKDNQSNQSAQILETYKMVFFWNKKIEISIMGLSILTTVVLFLYAVLVFQTNELLWSCVFSPAGALLRIIAGDLLNKRFPFGTLLVNLSGTALIGVMFILAHINPNYIATTDYASLFSCAVMIGVANGFCGCLTTLSSFIHEIHTSKYRIIYLAISLLFAQAILVLIVGTPYWTDRLTILDHAMCR